MTCKPILIVLALMLLVQIHALAQVTADDFLSPIQGGQAEIQNPKSVTTEEKVITAPSAQDAINTAVQQNQKELSGGDTSDIGAKMVKFPSGLGVVASGMATYRVMENATASRIAKRQAYVIAFTQAKKNMAEFLGGLSNDGKETIRQALLNVETDKESKTNISTSSEESLTQAVDMLLRGFVVYEVRDDDKSNTVMVSIVSTPKTRAKLARPAPSTIVADDIRQGLDQVIQEVRAGLVTPVGGRIIIVRTTGETAFVGFGSTVVRSNENAAVQAKLNLEAQKVASAKAKDALCGMIIGDRSSWTGSVRESMLDDVQEFEPALQGDPLAPNASDGPKFEQQRQTFVARMESTDVYQSARRGNLPPGVNVKTWFTDDNGWVYGMAVYIPSVTSAVGQIANEMKNSKPLQPGASNPPSNAADERPGFRDETNPNVPQPGKDIKPGPTGRINDDDL